MKKIHGFSVKAVSLIISVCVMLSALSVGFAFTAQSDSTDNVWSGNVADSYEGGSGTKTDPYKIADGEQLAKLAKDSETSGKYYILTADIILNDTSAADWKNGAKEWYGYDRAADFPGKFSGNLNGDGHTISGLYYNGSHYYFGLFASLGDALIENIIVADSYIATSNSAGNISVFTGHINGTVNYSSCIVAETVSISGVEASCFGSWNKGDITVDSCAALASVSGSLHAGAFFADVWQSRLVITNSFGIGTFSPRRGITSTNNYGTVADTYGTNVIDKLYMQGSAAKTNMPKLDWDRWETTDGYPTIKMQNPDANLGNIWSGSVATSYAGGNGTKDNPYIIETAEQLARMVSVGDTKGGYYSITKDIYLNDVSKLDWTSNSPNEWYDRAGVNNTAFVGNIEGNGHTIYGLFYDGNGYAALLPQAKDTTIKNLNIKNSSITSKYPVGALISFGQSTVSFYGCSVDDTVNLTGVTSGSGLSNPAGDVGAFVAYGTPSVIIDNSAATANITGGTNAGAFIGDCWWANGVTHKITNSFGAGKPLDAKLGFTAEKCYNTVNETKSVTGKVTKLASSDLMKGEAAKLNMPDLNWSTWRTTSGYPVPGESNPNGTKGEVWSGGIAESYAGGSGIEGDPYLIETPEQLARMVGYDVLTKYTGNIQNESANKYYKLTADIYLNDVSDSKWYEKSGLNKWYTSSASRFCGNLDGDGFTVYGLYSDSDAEYIGLFPVIDAWTNDRYFENITISHSYLSTSNNASKVGTIAGRAYSGNNKCIYFDNCYITESVILNNASTSEYWGGFVGFQQSNSKSFYSFTGCASLAKINRGFGFLGVEALGGTTSISNCFALADKYYPKSGSLSDSYLLTDLSTIYGTNAKTKMPNLAWDYIWKTVDDGYPTYYSRDYDVNGTVGAVWSGLTAKDYAGGTGTALDPYKIATAEQFIKMLKDTQNEGKYYELISDIKFNNTDGDNWTENARKMSCITNRFKGVFDGKGHTVSGYYYDGNDSNIGLFCITDKAIIKNVVFDNSYIKSSGYAVGGIVGQAINELKLDKCYVGENVYVESTYSGNDAGAGGLVGYGNAKITVNGSAFLGEVKATKFAGAILGNCWYKNELQKADNNITNSFSSASVNFCTKQWLGSGSDNNYSAATENENYVISLSKDKMTGEKAMENMSGLDWGRIWKTDSKGYPVCRFSDIISTPDGVWTGNIATEYAGGSGTADAPYLIENGEQLALLVTDTDTEGKYYKLIADIKLNDTSSALWRFFARQWIWSENVFKGTLDGDVHTISGLYYNGTKSKVGLFCYAKNAEIKRVIIDNAYICSTGYAVGSILGDANSGTVKITECYIGENVAVKSTFSADGNVGAGGIVGYGGAAITINGCAFLGEVSAPKFAGAFAGNCWAYNAIIIKNSFTNSSLPYCSKSSISGDSANNYAAGETAENGVHLISKDKMLGKKAKENMPLLNWFRSWKTTEKGYPVLNVGEYEGKVGEPWSGRLAVGFAGGSGTESDPYLISTPEQLAFLLENVLDSVGKHYKLTDDIYLNDISNPNWEKEDPRSWYWVASARKGNFNGHFDGDGHVIYGMYLNIVPTNSVVYTGLFPTISDGTVIEKVGLSTVSMTVNWDDLTKQSYVGGITGYIFFNLSDEETDPANIPVISQCFGDSKVNLTGRFAGGMVAGAPRPANISNSYFIGTVTGERVGAIIGNSWNDFEGATVTKNYAATMAEDIFCGGRSGVQNSATAYNYVDNYTNASGSVSGHATQISLLMMRGEAAKKNMPALDFKNIWYALPNGTPVLRIFGTTDKFSNTEDPEPIEVSFVSNGGSDCETVYGNPEEKLELPKPVREGYIFDGWYVYRELDIPYSIDYFPYFDQILYAKWTPMGIIQDFEEYPDSIYDLGYDYEFYKPGVLDYNALYVRSGMAAMHRIGLDSEDSDFLVNYMDMLTVGKKYKMSFWVTTDTPNTSVTLSLVHEDWPDVYDTDSGINKITELSSMKVGEWEKVEYTFIANTRWVAIRTSGSSSVFFDDVMIVPLSDKIYPVVNNGNMEDNWQNNEDTNEETQEEIITDSDENEEEETTSKTKIVRIKKKRRNNNNNLWWIIGLSAGGAVLIAAITVLLIIILKRKKKKKA